MPDQESLIPWSDSNLLTNVLAAECQYKAIIVSPIIEIMTKVASTGGLGTDPSGLVGLCRPILLLGMILTWHCSAKTLPCMHTSVMIGIECSDSVSATLERTAQQGSSSNREECPTG
jgi:hypothetical protein